MEREKSGRQGSLNGQRGRVLPSAHSPEVPLGTLRFREEGGAFVNVLAPPAGRTWPRFSQQPGQGASCRAELKSPFLAHSRWTHYGAM